MEARFEDDTTLAHRLHRRGGRVRQHPGTAAELDWLLYNKPLEYAQLVLGGEIEHYLSLGCDHADWKIKDSAAVRKKLKNHLAKSIAI